MNFYHQYKWVLFGAALSATLLISIISRKYYQIKKVTTPFLLTRLDSVIHLSSIQLKFNNDNIYLLTSELTKKFYQDRGMEAVWINDGHLIPQLDSLIKAISWAENEGLDSTEYFFSEIKNLQKNLINIKWQRSDNEKLVVLDILATDTYLKYADHLHSGRINPTKFDTNWVPYLDRVDAAELLSKSLEQNKIESSLKNLLPKHDQYIKLRQQLWFYQSISREGGWEAVPLDEAVKNLSSGVSDSMIFIIKKHLAQIGQIDKKDINDTFDEALSRSLRRYQYKNGLVVNGKLDKITTRHLNVPVEKILKKISLNMERYKWIPENLGEKYIAVNIPAFELNVFEKYNCKVMDMKVIVGRDSTPTAIFSDTMDNMIFSPEWNVPLSIAKKELLPLLKSNPDKIEEQGILVYENWGVKAKKISLYDINWEEVKPLDFKYRLVALASRFNPLGLVMFNFPNSRHIYLHDTPYDYLFSYPNRALSHGCIRVQYPVHLAQFILETDPTWNRNKILENMDQYKPKKIKIPGKKIPIHLMYETAWVDENNKLIFRDDIYRHDRNQINGIEKSKRKLVESKMIVGVGTISLKENKKLN